jgi:hypothetical protein
MLKTHYAEISVGIKTIVRFHIHLISLSMISTRHVVALTKVIGLRFNRSRMLQCLLKPSEEVVADDIIRHMVSYNTCNQRLKSTAVR